MSNQVELRLSGSGGQGLLLAGVILAEAGIIDNKNAIQTQSYGPEARGGASKAEVIIGEDEIYFPKVQNPDIILALTQEACDKYIESINEDGTVIIDDAITLPEGLKVKNVVKVPILKTASEKVGKSIVANIVALGCLTAFTDVVSKESLKEAVLKRVPKGTEKLNEMALESGYSLV